MLAWQGLSKLNNPTHHFDTILSDASFKTSLEKVHLAIYLTALNSPTKLAQNK